ncbi:IS66 family insertion sequence element accessory protein TnpB [Candidatus Galacturonibacter soehngenii]|uniref:IS66 family insertion sequence element accessory protein TnpB n=1 Tax=Candidatus Galacturonatibacter soehngenii TaxID=2307010 RepID=A0A7V7QKJ9_9FIRM|nr:IS66 family insertion sequence element accessory protein TnpB [Candidatus Galacturonibacter soehngenii]KAB1438340.1 IS66 family insertion sequence element accessory protein TnpB [Candidatus Galacturonibacter soehngenii]
MLGDISKAESIYLACGYTDMRKSIDGLAAMVQQNFHLDPFSNSLFLFCGRKCSRLKALYWEGDGFVILYKRLESGSFQWPRNQDEIQKISQQEFRWLLEGLSINQPKAVRKINIKQAI